MKSIFDEKKLSRDAKLSFVGTNGWSLKSSSKGSFIYLFFIFNVRGDIEKANSALSQVCNPRDEEGKKN